MIPEPIILEPAHRHQVPEADMLHALRHESHHYVMPDGMVMVIGADRTGVLIEVGLIEWYGMLAIDHAMRPARRKFL